jgi:hypothetical protein
MGFNNGGYGSLHYWRITMNARVSRPTPGELKKVNVEIADAHQWKLRCLTCGAEWWPNLRRGGRLPRGYWKCYQGCNDQRQAA